MLVAVLDNKDDLNIIFDYRLVSDQDEDSVY